MDDESNVFHPFHLIELFVIEFGNQFDSFNARIVTEGRLYSIEVFWWPCSPQQRKNTMGIVGRDTFGFEVDVRRAERFMEGEVLRRETKFGDSIHYWGANLPTNIRIFICKIF